jgi:hypothetical protein
MREGERPRVEKRETMREREGAAERKKREKEMRLG